MTYTVKLPEGSDYTWNIQVLLNYNDPANSQYGRWFDLTKHTYNGQERNYVGSVSAMCSVFPYFSGMKLTLIGLDKANDEISGLSNYLHIGQGMVFIITQKYVNNIEHRWAVVGRISEIKKKDKYIWEVTVEDETYYRTKNTIFEAKEWILTIDLTTRYWRTIDLDNAIKYILAMSIEGNIFPNTIDVEVNSEHYSLDTYKGVALKEFYSAERTTTSSSGWIPSRMHVRDKTLYSLVDDWINKMGYRLYPYSGYVCFPTPYDEGYYSQPRMEKTGKEYVISSSTVFDYGGANKNILKPIKWEQNKSLFLTSLNTIYVGSDEDTNSKIVVATEPSLEFNVGWINSADNSEWGSVRQKIRETDIRGKTISAILLKDIQVISNDNTFPVGTIELQLVYTLNSTQYTYGFDVFEGRRLYKDWNNGAIIWDEIYFVPSYNRGCMSVPSNATDIYIVLWFVGNYSSNKYFKVGVHEEDGGGYGGTDYHCEQRVNGSWTGNNRQDLCLVIYTNMVRKELETTASDEIIQKYGKINRTLKYIDVVSEDTVRVMNERIINTFSNPDRITNGEVCLKRSKDYLSTLYPNRKIKITDATNNITEQEFIIRTVEFRFPECLFYLQLTPYTADTTTDLYMMKQQIDDMQRFL